jgi:hypothetical protein
MRVGPPAAVPRRRCLVCQMIAGPSSSRPGRRGTEGARGRARASRPSPVPGTPPELRRSQRDGLHLGDEPGRAVAQERGDHGEGRVAEAAGVADVGAVRRLRRAERLEVRGHQLRAGEPLAVPPVTWPSGPGISVLGQQPVRESNPPLRLERAVSSAARRTGRSPSGPGGAGIHVCGASNRRYSASATGPRVVLCPDRGRSSRGCSRAPRQFSECVYLAAPIGTSAWPGPRRIASRRSHYLVA